MNKQNIPALTGLRFFAAMAIVLFHSQTGYFFPYGVFSPFYLAGAVPVFFVLSGFVLTIGAGRYRTWADFFVARIARVWPAHIAALVFLFLVFYPYSLDFFHHAETVGRLILNVLLLQAWSPESATYWSYNAPSWSVSCELFFYAAFPIAVACLSQQTLIRTVVLVATIFFCIMLVNAASPGLDTNWLAVTNPVSCSAAFVIGVAAGVWRKRLPPTTKAGCGMGTILQGTALAGAMGANAVFASHPVNLLPAARLFLVTFGPAPFYAALLLLLARYDGLISRALSNRAIVYGGEISYSIYLFHQIIIRWHSGFLQVLSPVPMWFQYVGVLLATFAIAVLANRCVERPARRLILGVWSRMSWGVRKTSIEQSKLNRRYAEAGPSDDRTRLH